MGKKKKIPKEWKIDEKVKNKLFLARDTAKEIIIYGCGKNGFFTKETLKLFDIPISYYCDSDPKKVGLYVDGIFVISKQELVKKHNQALIIIASSLYSKEIYDYLIDSSFLSENIINPSYGLVLGVCGNQYFDFFCPQNQEYFIDAGAFDGQTTVDFYKWGGVASKGAYLLEPFLETKDLIEKNISSLKNAYVYYAAAWDKYEDLMLDGEARGTVVSVTEGKQKIKGIPLDGLLNDQIVTYIKMDVEGSELAALHGAKKIICRDKPRLAICIYHKPNDITEIPKYLNELVPEYKFALRHYTTYMWETVLYAWINA